MKFYFEGSYNEQPKKEGKLAKVSAFPPTQNSSCREICVLVAKEIESVESGLEVNLGMVGKGEKKTPMIFPHTPKNVQEADKRILVMGIVPQPKHRQDGRLYLERDGDAKKTNGHLLDVSNGGGAWGSGCAFLAVLKPNERVVSNRFIVWENVDGDLKKSKFDSLCEYLLFYEKPEINFI
jgi:hypothetical protein